MKKLSFLFLVLALAGCSSGGDTLGDIEQREFLISGFKLGEKPKGDLNIYEAVARAFKNGLEPRMETLRKVMEQELRKEEYSDILPKIVEVAGYKARYNPDFYFAILGAELETRDVAVRPRHRNSLAMVWNMIDFSLSYTTAKQYGTPSLLTENTKRKAMQNIASDVKLAFYRVAGAQNIQDDVDVIEKKLRDSLAALEKSPDRSRLVSYETALKTSLNQVLALKKEAFVAKLELSALLGLGQYTDYRVQPPVDFTTEKLNKYRLDDLELQAAQRRQEMTALNMDAKKEIISMRKQVAAILPDAEFGYKDRGDYDYFQNQAWEEAGMKISWNLISLMNTLLAAPTKEEQLALYKIYSVAAGTAILSEVNIAYLRFVQALNNFQIVLMLSEVKENIAKDSATIEVANITDLDVVTKKIEYLLAKSKIYYSYGELKDAEDALLLSIGVRNYPAFISPTNIRTMIDGTGADDTLPLRVTEDETIEHEVWATGDNWLEGTVSGVDKGTITPPSPSPAQPAAPTIVPETPQGNPIALIDPKTYSALVADAREPVKATVRRKTSPASGSAEKRLQLGSYKEEARAVAAWQEFIGKYPELSDYRHGVVAADVTGVGRVYRLSVAGTAAALKNLCPKLKAELGGSCIVR